MTPRTMTLAFVLTLTTLFYGMSSSAAYAYLDPGTGSMILQVLLGGLAGLALAGRFYWQRFLVFIGVRSDQAEDEDPNSRADK